MDVTGVIPARYESTRLPHKLLRPLLGKPLIQWTWEVARGAHLLDELIIACDHPEVERVAKDFGAQVLFTSPQHISGTDRICEVVDTIETKIVMNIQADEPLIHHSVIDSLINQMLSNPSLVMTTVKKRIDNEQEIHDPNIVKVATDRDGFAIYFSRSPIPYNRDHLEGIAYYKHLGIYAYTKEFLYIFKNLPESTLEKAERLEQLRVLEAGYEIKVVETNYDCWGVDTEKDLQKVERILAERSRP